MLRDNGTKISGLAPVVGLLFHPQSEKREMTTLTAWAPYWQMQLTA
jgi:hypothetical protein